jgi:S-formylglutathione hydrolase FrmB
MALLRIDHVPETIKVNLPLYLILPDPASAREVPLKDRKVLYLLHGLSDDGSAWQRYTSIETVAYDLDLVVVMPSVGRSFYADLPNGQAYYTYITQELPQYLEDIFGIPQIRQNTLVAGNSMGGYGAFKCAFLHPERYFAAASLSGVLSLKILEVLHNDPRSPEFSSIFGNLSKLPGTEHDPAVWFQRAASNPSALPELYMSCGKQDDLYPLNAWVHLSLQQMGIPVEYQEEDAGHVWTFWDREIRRFLNRFAGIQKEQMG